MLVMAWSPLRRFNAGFVWVEQPGDYATLNSNQPRDGTILRQKNTQLGIQHFVFKNLPTPVHKFRIQTIGDEPFGYAIDNVAFKRKPPLP
jgi:hypothetical protein